MTRGWHTTRRHRNLLPLHHLFQFELGLTEVEKDLSDIMGTEKRESESSAEVMKEVGTAETVGQVRCKAEEMQKISTRKNKLDLLCFRPISR